MSSARKVKFKDGAAVVIGVVEGTMTADVEDDVEEDDEVANHKVANHDSVGLPAILACLNTTQVWRVTGSFVSAPNGVRCSCRCDTTRSSAHVSPSPLCPLPRRVSKVKEPASY